MGGTGGREIRGETSGAGLWAWYALSLAVLVLVPAAAWLREPIWRLPGADVLQVAVTAAGYLGLALAVSGLAPRPLAHNALRVFLSALVIFATGYALLSLWNDAPRSRGLFVGAMLLSTILALYPLLASRLRAVYVVVALMLFLLFAAWAIRAQRKAQTKAPVSTRMLTTAIAQVEVRYHSGLTGPAEGDGGGITANGGGFLVITGRGVLFDISWDSTGRGLRSRRLPVPSPLNRDVFLRDRADSATQIRLRVTDLALDTTVSPARLYVAHDYWNHERKCITLRVSSTSLDSRTRAATGPWTTEFDSKPCVPIIPAFDDIETGGRFAWDAQGNLLVTVGDHGFNGIMSEQYPQIDSVDYGKIFRRDRLSRAWKVFTIGHRNEQGLTVDHEGRIWETEHGPQGGDELNVIVEGRNYGWPVATYGTEYGRTFWPVTPRQHDHGDFAEPAFAWVPSIGISSLIEVHGTRIPQWTGDLLIGSLRTQSLWRVRKRGEHVLYVEPIKIGRRIRDIEEGSAGQIVLWTDEGDLVSVDTVLTSASPELAFGTCAGCHVPTIQGTALGPPLEGVVGRRVGSVPGYQYSDALRKLGGTWTEQRLDAFLRQPASYAPGTRMAFAGVSDSVERRMIIEHLRSSSTKPR